MRFYIAKGHSPEVCESEKLQYEYNGNFVPPFPNASVCPEYSI